MYNSWKPAITELGSTFERVLQILPTLPQTEIPSYNLFHFWDNAGDGVV